MTKISSLFDFFFHYFVDDRIKVYPYSETESDFATVHRNFCYFKIIKPVIASVA